MPQQPSRRLFLRLSTSGGLAIGLGACRPEEAATDGTVPASPSTNTPVVLTDAGDIPPITANEDFYVQSYAGTPSVDPETWQLEIDGACSASATLSLADLEAFEARDKEHTLICIGSSPIYKAISNAIWSGLPLIEILDSLGITATEDAIELHLYGADGYVTALPISDLDDREIWLVWRMNGEPLPAEHGYPARLLVPDRYGTKNPKWLTHLEFGTKALLGTWERSGWSNDASIQAIGYALAPASIAQTTLGEVVRLQGAGFSGSASITQVELSEDDGRTWTAADLVYQGDADGWTLWSFEWRADKVGDFTLMIRVAAEDGRATNPSSLDQYEGYGGYDQVTISVS